MMKEKILSTEKGTNKIDSRKGKGKETHGGFSPW